MIRIINKKAVNIFYIVKTSLGEYGLLWRSADYYFEGVLVIKLTTWILN